MMRFNVYTLDQSEEWDSVVRSFKNYDVYWRSGYVKAFQIHGDGDPLLFFYDDGKTRGINVVMKRDIASDVHYKNLIPENTYFDFATPYGYGGWIIEGQEVSGLFHAYNEWLKENGIVSEFVRFHPIIKNHIACRSFYEVIQLGEVVHIDLSSPGIIWSNITSKNRNVIRKAKKNDVRIYNGRFPEIYNSFRSIYNDTMKKDNAEKYYFFEPEFYSSCLDDLPENAQVFWAEKNGEVIAASIILAANGFMNYHLSGSLPEYRSLAPTNLLLYEAALWGFENGFKTFYLGGGVGSGEDNLFKFKKSFNKNSMNYFNIGKKIHNETRYNELLHLREPAGRNYFPEYRA